MGDDRQTAFFSSDNGYFVGTDAARGPWSEDACHGGPVAGLLARAVELLVPAKQLTRLTVELTRPAPMAGFRIEADLLRDGRLLANAAARVVDRDGRVCASAASAHIAARELGSVPTCLPQAPDFEDSRPGRFSIGGGPHRLPTFGSAIEVRLPTDRHMDTGPSTVWMKSPPLLDNEDPSPFQRLCPLADCGNALSRNADMSTLTFINIDLTITMYRAPVSDWIASSSMSHWQPTGIGLAEAMLFDTRGAVGSAQQTLIIDRR